MNTITIRTTKGVFSLVYGYSAGQRLRSMADVRSDVAMGAKGRQRGPRFFLSYFPFARLEFEQMQCGGSGLFFPLRFPYCLKW